MRQPNGTQLEERTSMFLDSSFFALMNVMCTKRAETEDLFSYCSYCRSLLSDTGRQS